MSEIHPKKYEDELSNLFSDRISWQTPEMLLEEYGEQGLANLYNKVQINLKEHEVTRDELRSALDIANETVKDLRADIDMIQQAQQLGRDKGLE